MNHSTSTIISILELFSVILIESFSTNTNRWQAPDEDWPEFKSAPEGFQSLDKSQSTNLSAHFIQMVIDIGTNTWT